MLMKHFYKSKRRTLILLLWLCSSVAVLAQERIISGNVKDEAGSPLPGVNVLVKGTASGTVTDTNGSFKINAKESDVLIVSFIGFKTTEVTVGNQATIDIGLTPDVTSLSEVVVTGYGSERKQDIVSAVSTISAANTVAIPLSNVEQAMQGRVAGVQVTTSGQPGASSQVRIRGFGSLTSNTPLYIVDGVPTYDVSNINPYDIESTTILKDAGAASIYGSRAAAGVIVYTTKHGKNDGKTRVDFDMSSGLNMPGKGQDMLNPTQQAQAVYTALNNSGVGTGGKPYGSNISAPQLPDYINVGVQQGDGSWKPTPIFLSGPNQTPGAAGLVAAGIANYNVDYSKGPIVQVVAANKSGTDWYKAMTRVAPVNRYSLGMSGGTDRAHYYLNLSYYNQQGLAINQYLKRYNVRLNSEFKPHKAVRIGENLLLTYRDNPQIGNPQSENQLNLAYRMPTIIPVHDMFGNYAGTAAPGFNNPGNPVASLQRLNKNYNQSNGTSIFGNTYIEADPIQHLTLRSSFGGSITYSNFLNYSPETYENAENTSSNTYTEGSSTRTTWVFTNTARYQNKFGDHGITVFGGYEAVKDPAYSHFLQGFGLNPFSSDPNYLNVSNTNASGRQVSSGLPTTSSGYQDNTRALASSFGKIDYNFKEKYYLSGTIRHDASSIFGSQKRSGVFPAISAAWRITSESFMQGISWLDDLKLRGSWGTMGNQNINPSNQYTLFTGGPANGYDINGTNNSVVGGAIPNQIGNIQGAWEKNTSSNIGLDGTFMHGSLEIVLEVWQKKTTGLLYAPNIPATAGVYPSNPTINIASMQNRGIDFQFIKRVKVTSDLHLVLDGNFSPLQNKITSLAPGINYFDGTNFRNVTFNRNAVGQTLAAFYGYQQTGYFKDAADVSSSAVQDGAAPGRFKFADTNHDGKIDDTDRKFLGSPIPKFTYGFNLTATYKNFSLNAFFYGKYGNKIANFSKWYNNFYQSFSDAGLAKNVLSAWTPELGNSAKTPILETASNFSTNTVGNSWYLESGSYLRLKNLQLNYSIPASLITKYGINRFRVYAQAVNLFTITKYTGKDPEVASQVDTTLGVDIGNYPATRIWSLGCNIGF